MKISLKLHSPLFLFCAIFAAVFVAAGCGSGGGEPSSAPPGGAANPPTDTPASTTLYPSYPSSCLSITRATDCNIHKFRLGSIAEYRATLNGDITGTAAGIHIWIHAVGTQFDAYLILKKGGQEKQLASWTGLTTTNESEYELIEKSAVIEEQETAVGDIIIFRMTSANSEEWVSLKFGCLDSHITIPSLGGNSLSCSGGATSPADCSAFTITPSDATATFGEQIAFEVENGAPPYTWSIDTSIDSILDDSGNYTAGNAPGLDLVSVTDSDDCAASAVVDVTE